MLLEITGVRRQVLISICMYLGQITVGYTHSWTGPVVSKFRDLEQSPLPYLLKETEISLVASLIYIGALPGPFLTGWLSNVKGRKPCFFLGGVFLALSYVILSSATNLAMLYVGRILSGFGMSAIGVMNLVYIGEIASTHTRGILLTVVGIFTTIGSMLIFSIGPFLSYAGTGYVGLALCLIFTASTLLIPETPVYYILKGNDDAVRKILQELGRDNEVDKLLASKKMNTDITAQKDWVDLFVLKSNRKGLLIVIVTNILQNCSGFLGVIFFASTIFKTAGSSIDANISMIIIGCFELVGSSSTPFFVERFGRKTLLVLSSVICCLSMVILGVYFYLVHIEDSNIDKIKWLPLVILIMFFVAYDFGLGIIPNTLIGEIFTINVRSNGSAVALSTSWFSGFLVASAFGAMMEHFGVYGVFWFHAGISGCSVIFAIFFVPETKGKSLLEIQDLLSK